MEFYEERIRNLESSLYRIEFAIEHLTQNLIKLKDSTELRHSNNLARQYNLAHSTIGGWSAIFSEIFMGPPPVVVTNQGQLRTVCNDPVQRSQLFEYYTGQEVVGYDATYYLRMLSIALGVTPVPLNAPIPPIPPMVHPPGAIGPIV